MQMAVFLLNTCKFSGCGLTFATLAELIQHIEETHIDTDPRILEKQELQQPPSLALSYVLRVFTDAARKENVELHKKRARAQSPASSVRSNTPTGSEFDEEEVVSEDDDSDDSWTTQEEFTSELILSMMNSKDGDGEKPFACPVPGCKKRYKNVNGIKYHAKHGHRKDARVKKAFKCRCGKSYKTSQGLRNHALTHHPPTELLAAAVQRPKLVQAATLQQALGSLAEARMTQAALTPVTSLQHTPVCQAKTLVHSEVIATTAQNVVGQNGLAATVVQSDLGHGVTQISAIPTAHLTQVLTPATVAAALQQSVSQ